MTYTYKNPYLDHLIYIQKPARYTGHEHYSINKEWTAKIAKVALCFPDTYEIGMSHLGYKILYNELNKNENILAERSFAPWVDMEEVLRNYKLPLVTLENFRPLSDFDIVGFSLQHEMSYTNLINMLDLGNVPIYQKTRSNTDPFVICGGPCATHPEPLADFTDLFVIGDGEAIFEKIILLIKKLKDQNINRKHILEEMSKLTGVYVPSLYDVEIDPVSQLQFVKTDKPIKMFTVDSLANYPFPTKSPIPHLTAVFDNFSFEIARGCNEGCRFCQAGMIYRPNRERTPVEIINGLIDGINSCGFDTASLTCLSTADYSSITPLLLLLLDLFEKRNITLGLSSLRAYGLNPEILDKISQRKNISLTFAPEAGSERLRNIINKNITEQDITTTTREVFSRGWQKMKLYFMIGLPQETNNDVREIIELSNRLKHIANSKSKRASQITVSVSSFVPRPHTPFQWCAMDALETIEEKQEILFQLAREKKVTLKKHTSNISVLECLIARGDRRIGQVIFDVWKSGGRFDNWQEVFKIDLWNKAIVTTGIDTSIYLNSISLENSRLPWDHINVGVSKQFLIDEHEKSIMAEPTPPCSKPNNQIQHPATLNDFKKTFEEEKKKLLCHNCGVKCNLPQTITKRKEGFESIEQMKSDDLVKKFLDTNLNEKIARYRVKFSKTLPISYISHLDLQKVIARIFRRSNIEVAYSKGFHPRPLISFGPALALGIDSLEEYLDFHLTYTEENPTRLLDQLQSNSEEGITFLDINKISNSTRSIQEITTEQVYFFPLKESGNNSEELLANFNATTNITITAINHKKGGTITKELKKFIASASIFSIPEQLSRQLNCSLTGIKIVTIPIDSKQIKPSELFQILNDAGIITTLPIKISSSIGQSL